MAVSERWVQLIEEFLVSKGTPINSVQIIQVPNSYSIGSSYYVLAKFGGDTPMCITSPAALPPTVAGLATELSRVSQAIYAKYLMNIKGEIASAPKPKLVRPSTKPLGPPPWIATDPWNPDPWSIRSPTFDYGEEEDRRRDNWIITTTDGTGAIDPQAAPAPTPVPQPQPKPAPKSEPINPLEPPKRKMDMDL